MPPYIVYYLAILALVSLVAFGAYGIDKFKARHDRWRIPEAFLLGVGFCGGAIGALLGMRAFRHKTKHIKFTAGIPAILIAQILLVMYIHFGI